MAKGSGAFTTGEVAKMAGVSMKKAASWIDSGLLKGYRLPGGGEDRRVPKAEMRRFLADHGMPLGELALADRRVMLVAACDDVVYASRAGMRGDGFDVRLAADAFGAGRLACEFSPQAVMIDFAAGRAESLRLVASLRAAGAAFLLALAGEDEGDGGMEWLVDCGGFDDAFRRPECPARVAARLRAFFEEGGAA